ncbi:hypothetical protein KAU40_01505 [Candidatus Parcubacteria bacterium]|nr:hypothetical protein [Candidatus Parcubacteria bacterium]
MPLVIGNTETNVQFNSQEDIDIVGRAIRTVLVFVEAESSSCDYGDGPSGECLEDRDIPPGFDYTKVALEAYKELLNLRTNVRKLSSQREQNFLVDFIKKRRMSL